MELGAIAFKPWGRGERRLMRKSVYIAKQRRLEIREHRKHQDPERGQKQPKTGT